MRDCITNDIDHQLLVVPILIGNNHISLYSTVNYKTKYFKYDDLEW